MRRRVCLAVLLALAAGPVQAQGVSGAGSTLAFPVLARWSQAFQRSQADTEYQPVGAGLEYEPIGSQAGIMRLRDGAADFGATDAPLGPDELGQAYAQFPVVIGGVVVAVRIEGIASGQLRLTGEALAEIYAGRIRTWSDPALRALNPGLTLPDAPIAVLRRSDGSGTTATFTNYLSKSNPQWRASVGEGLVVAWPTGSTAKGNDGMAEAVQRTPNAIGYVDYTQAQRAGLAHALLRNRDGAFVAPAVDGFRAAAASAGWGVATGPDVMLTDAAGPGAYPIVATTYIVMPRSGGRASRAVLAFFRWSLDNGAPAASALGYVPLPPALVEQVKAYWAATFRG